MKLSLIIFIILIINYSHCQLEEYKDDDLVKFISSENYVVVLFTQKNCDNCQNYENELISLREDLVENLNCWVVKVYTSSLLRLYTSEKEPVIVFFRHGIPLLYDGPLDDHLVHVLLNNKEPTVKELNDENFEHLTQVGTGATTGDWFIQFYTTECIECQRFQARWETVGARIKSRINTARINRATVGAKTARRFDVFNVPTFILFKNGQMYKYHGQDYSVKSLVAFAQDTYKTISIPEPVPEPKEFFDDLLAATLTILWETPYLWLIGIVAFIIGLGAALLLLRLTKKPKKTKKQTTKQKKNVKKVE